MLKIAHLDSNVYMYHGAWSDGTIQVCTSLMMQLSCLCVVMSILFGHGMAQGNTVCSFYPAEHHGVHGLNVDCSQKQLTEVPTLPNSTLSLNLSLNLLSGLPEAAFAHLHDLFNLDASNNTIEQINPRAFIGLRRLEILDLSSNMLQMTNETYDPEVFTPLVNLKIIMLNDNIKWSKSEYNYPSVALSRLTNLESIYIDGIPNGIFGPGMRKLHNLRYLAMTYFSGKGYCHIPHISAMFFQHIPNLTKLYLLNCGIQYIHESAFTHLKQIVLLCLAYNQGLGFDRMGIGLSGLAGSKTIRELVLTRIRPIDDIEINVKKHHIWWMKNTSIESIHFGENGIRSFEPGVITSCIPSSLKGFYMQFNKLHFSGIYIFELRNLTSLEVIIVKGNGQSQRQINNKFGYLPKLRVLDISLNAIMNWRYASFLRTVVQLDLSQNNCKGVYPGFFTHGGKLERLDVSKNYLGNVLNAQGNSELMNPLVSLKYLDLSTNLIRETRSDLLTTQISLEQFILRQNSLKVFNIEISHMRNLSLLDISFNRVATLSEHTRASLDIRGSALVVDLRSNDVECSCDNRAYIRWMLTTAVVIRRDKMFPCRLLNGTTRSYYLNDMSDFLDRQCANYTSMILLTLFIVIAYSAAICFGLVRRQLWALRYLYYLSRAKYYGFENLNERPYVYDAFISYAKEDYQFVTSDFVTNLEEIHGLRLCIHHRDFIPGQPIADGILRSIHSSRHTVVVLSESFVASSWCRYEFNMARMESIQEDRNVVIIVDYKTVSKKRIPAEIEEIRLLDTYITYVPGAGEDGFWTSLQSAIRGN